MIDTDKYEGHSPQEKWHIDESSVGMGKGFVGSLCLCELCQDEVYLEGSNERELCDEVKANLRLMADVPLFLAEVKRLREVIKEIAQHDAKEYWSYELLQTVEMIE